MINEFFEIILNGHKIKIIHTGFKPLKNQKNGFKDVKDCIKESITIDGNLEGFIPYNNFECSITWEIIQNGYKKLQGLDAIDHLERRALLDAQIDC